MTNPTSPMLEKMGQALGEHLYATHDAKGDFITDVRPAMDLAEGSEIPGTITISLDGEIDLIALTKAALQSLKDLDEGTVEAMAQELRDARDYTDRTQALRAFTCGIYHILGTVAP